MATIDNRTYTYANDSKRVDLNKYLGGSTRGVKDHPYIKGYFYIFFIFPTAIFGGDEYGNGGDAQKYLLSLSESYTPPADRQLKTEDVQGLGGVDATFVTGQTLDRTFSLQFRELWDSPILRIHSLWTSYINPYLGGNTTATHDFAPSEYKGTCMIIQTKPVMRNKKGENKGFKADDIIKVDWYDGVVPLTDPITAYDANITDNGIVRPNIQYRFDGHPLDETMGDSTGTNIKKQALTFLNYEEYFGSSSHATFKKFIEDYNNDNTHATTADNKNTKMGGKNSQGNSAPLN